jgi:DNA processing protein
MKELLAWFQLKDVPGIGNHTYKRLIDRFTSPECVFEAREEDLMQVSGMRLSLVTALKSYRSADWITRELERVKEKGYRIIPLTDPAYPPLLREIPDPPPFLYVFGNLRNTQRSISVVGSRHATEYGISTTKRLCETLAQLGMTVVSGMARGIDTAAHIGAMQGNGNTVAVLGSGFDYIYPRENRDLFYEIGGKGAVVSEFSLKTEPDAHNFPARNRIISGMSLGTVVVEATQKSGSLITARLAAEQNREVFAVPGNVHSFKSIGTHRLIKQGAKLVEHAQDILEELPPGVLGDAPFPRPAQKQLPTLSREETDILEVLEPYPIHIDDLARKTKTAPGKLAGILLGLELKRLVDQIPGKRFALTNQRD